MTAQEIVDATRRLDKLYMAFTKTLPPPLQFQEIAVEVSQPEVYGNTVHRYASHRTAQLWNSYRMTRILLNEIIHGYSICLPSDSTRSLQIQAAANVQQMTVEICASIPQFINSAAFAVSLDSRSQLQPFTPMSPKSSAASLMWPLSAIRGASLASTGVRSYATERLKILGREFHLPQAKILHMDHVEDASEISALQDGLHMYYVS